MAAWRAVLLIVSSSALTTPPTQSLRKAIDEAKSVKRKDREAQAIDRAVARVTRDMDRVDFSSDRRGALERREKVALGAATAVAAGATLTAAAPAAAVAAGAAATAAIGGYKEWGALRAAANAHEVSAVAVRAAADAEEILAGAERVKSVLPVCVVLGATATALSSSAPALLELLEPATARNRFTPARGTAGAPPRRPAPPPAEDQPIPPANNRARDTDEVRRRRVARFG